jgi:hypothetical protein
MTRYYLEKRRQLPILMLNKSWYAYSSLEALFWVYGVVE